MRPSVSVGSPKQTFILFPIAAILLDAVTRRRVRIDIRFIPLLAIGYALYRVAGDHRRAKGAGANGFRSLPRRLVTDGPYAVSRNPMYVGHLIFMAGLVGLTRSPFAMLFAMRQALRFRRRVAIDEKRLAEAFGAEYDGYVRRVPRWLVR